MSSSSPVHNQTTNENSTTAFADSSLNVLSNSGYYNGSSPNSNITSHSNYNSPRSQTPPKLSSMSVEDEMTKYFKKKCEEKDKEIKILKEQRDSYQQQSEYTEQQLREEGKRWEEKTRALHSNIAKINEQNLILQEKLTRITKDSVAALIELQSQNEALKEEIETVRLAYKGMSEKNG